MLTERELFGIEWMWPARDTQCFEALRTEHENVAIVLKWCEDVLGRPVRTVIQAGGNAGLFPVMLAWQGCRVLTFEPLIENFNALVQNLRHVRNGIVWPVFGGLDDEAGQVDMLSMTGEVNNTGAGYTSATDQQGVPMYDIDTFFPHGDLDLVWLDVEGDELPALKGMETTILKHKPVIVLELKGLGSRRGYTDADVHAWLNERGYGGYAGIGRDVCFVPKTAR